MKLRLLTLAAMVGIVLLAGCAAVDVQESKGYKAYKDEMKDWTLGRRCAVTLKDWVADLGDIVSVEAGVGEIYGGKIQITELGQFGALFGRVMKLGWRDRVLGFYNEVRKEGGASWFYYRDLRMEPLTGTEGLFERRRLMKHFPIRHNDDWHWADCGVEAGFVFGDVSMHVSPKHTLDFFISTIALPYELTVKQIFYGAGMRPPEIDICQDDTAARILREKHSEVVTIEHPDGFWPVEYLDELMRLPY